MVTRILILGGTGWLGTVLARCLVASGHAVTCLARGEAGSVPPGVTFVRADRRAPGAYDAVAATPWDRVVELAYESPLVEGTLDALAATARHWTLVSTVSVYEGNDVPGADEDAPLVTPTDPENYAHAKAAAEQRTREAVGEGLLLARPGLIVGPGDPSDRFSYWVARMALAPGGDILTPPTSDRYVQYIDVRDLAAWLERAMVRRLTGTYNAIGRPHRFADFLRAAAGSARYTGTLVTAGDDWLLDHGVNYWAGPRSLPLWLPAPDAPIAQRSSERFHTSGGAARSLAETLRDVLDDERHRGLARPRRSGLTREEEVELLAAWDRR